MNGLVTLADLPELRGTAAKPRATITIGRLDSNLRDPRYGKFAITQAEVDSWKRNLAGVMGGQVSIDFDHSSDRGQGTKAAAWITSIGQEGKLITADVEFTKKGAKAVRNGTYKYTSPTFVANYTDEHGDKHGPALIGAALTNRPVLRKGMPTLSLSRDEFDGVELARVSARTRKRTATLKGKGKPAFPMPDALHARLALQFVGRSLKKGNITPADAAKIRARARAMLGKPKKSALARDSRGQMDLTREELAVALGLPADSDTDAILGAVNVTLAKRYTGVPPAGNVGTSTPGNANAGPIASAAGKSSGQGPKTFVSNKKAKKGKKARQKKLQMALDSNGHVQLSADEYANLLTGANAGQNAALQLAEERFDRAWQQALSEGRAAPAQEDQLRRLFRKDQDGAIKLLDTFVKIVPTTPTGSGVGGPAGVAPTGVDPERFQLHSEATMLARQKRSTDPSLSESDAYTLAAAEIAERNRPPQPGAFAMDPLEAEQPFSTRQLTPEELGL